MKKFSNPFFVFSDVGQQETIVYANLIFVYFWKNERLLYAFLDFFVTVWYDARDKPKERGT